MMKQRGIGETVRMTKDALDNYGDKWHDVEMEITHTATKYMPASQFYAQGRPAGFHPGYDESAGCALYDLRRAGNGEAIPFSLYEWEVG